MSNGKDDILIGALLDESIQFSLSQLCRSCGVSAEELLRMVDEGVVEPTSGAEPATRWRFSGQCMRRVRVAIRLQRDLGVNLAGVALVLDMQERIERLERRLARNRGLE